MRSFSFFNASSSETENKNLYYKNEIISHLKYLKLSQQSIDTILNTVDKMPAHTHVLGALAFLTELTNQHSRCEKHYNRSDYLAEYFCTLSNIGFFAVAFYYQDYATLCAGTFSALSHAIPLKRLNDLDKIAALSLFIKVISNYQLVMNHPAIMAAGVATFGFGLLDLTIGRKHLATLGPIFHSAWHLAAAFSMYKFNQAQSLVSPDEIAKLTQAALSSTVPIYLQQYYTDVTNAISQFAKNHFPVYQTK